MFSLFLAIYFAFPSEISTTCDRNLLNSDEVLYKEILLSSKDSGTKLKYLQKFGGCIVSEGINLTEIRNIPVIEILDCKNPLKEKGSEVFFNNGKMCSRSVRFFPSRNVFIINDRLPIVSTDEQWNSVEGYDMTLFFNKSAPFSQFQDSEGRILTKKENGFFTDSLGKPAHPHFIYESGVWKVVYPLRELFELNVGATGIFSVKIISEAPIPYERNSLIETMGLKASDIVVETPLPSSYFIKGSHLKGIRIPFLSMSDSEDGFHGTYIFRLSYKGIEPKQLPPIEENDYSILVKTVSDLKELVLTVKSKELSKEEIDRITAYIHKEIPSFFITKSNADK